MVTIGGTTVALVNNGNGTYSFQVPAGTTGGIVVTVPTHDDAVFEGSEKLTLEATLSGKTASGVDLPAGITDTGNAAIVDQANGPSGADVPTLDVSNPGNVNEGSEPSSTSRWARPSTQKPPSPSSWAVTSSPTTSARPWSPSVAPRSPW
ncbi:Uncharacterised protein [Comamonas testosteroni]|uniref:Uncharacterized protein n=1 Tax=Comamonas testosteroni TaxID=285 RepID=A0A8B4S664_COMTE|nr:Uncharacterised protein [Comamonas testosteroni]